MTDQPQKHEGVGFFGLTIAYPRTVWGVMPFALVCATIAFVAHLLLSAPPNSADQPRRLWTPLVIITNGTEGVMAEARRMEFWTPSAKTKDFLARTNGSLFDDDKWQALASDDPVLQFGTLLHSNPGVLGYRRTEVWGHGRTSFKPGWWWTMTVSTNYPVDQFATAYRTFWKTPHAVFVEVIDNGVHEE